MHGIQSYKASGTREVLGITLRASESLLQVGCTKARAPTLISPPPPRAAPAPTPSPFAAAAQRRRWKVCKRLARSWRRPRSQRGGDQ